MNPTRIPGNEPDPGDMSAEPGTGPPNDKLENHDLPDEAENLGDFAKLQFNPVVTCGYAAARRTRRPNSGHSALTRQYPRPVACSCLSNG